MKFDGIENNLARTMSQNSTQKQALEQKHTKYITDKTLKVLADSIYQTLKDEGCENKDIIGVSSKLIGLVTDAIHQPSQL